MEPYDKVIALEIIPSKSDLIPIKPQNGKEKFRIQNRLRDFNPRENQAWKEITSRFGTSLKQPELLSIAQVLSQNANVKLDRDAKRRKCVLIKWFSENWSKLQPFLGYVILENSSDNTVPINPLQYQVSMPVPPLSQIPVQNMNQIPNLQNIPNIGSLAIQNIPHFQIQPNPQMPIPIGTQMAPISMMSYPSIQPQSGDIQYDSNPGGSL